MNLGKRVGRQEGRAECPEDAGWDMAAHADVMPPRPRRPVHGAQSDVSAIASMPFRAKPGARGQAEATVPLPALQTPPQWPRDTPDLPGSGGSCIS